MDQGPAEAVAAMVAGAAAGERDAADVAGWLASRLRPAGIPAASLKEEPMRVRPVLPLAGRIRNATARRQSTAPFRRFTDQARLAVQEATEAARLLRHAHVGTEHLLLGLLSDEEWLAGKALKSLGLSLAEVRRQVTEIARQGEHTSPGGIPFTPQARRALELSLREALGLGHNDIGTEHLLLGLLREHRCIAALVLNRLGAGHDRVREQVAGLAAPAGLAGAAEELDQVRAAKEAALDAEDFEAAKALRDREKELAALHAALTENQRLHREIERLRARLRDHGIEPRDHGAA
jgi:ATP-dependent Clp protease ATP-binding subunit ClpA